MKFACKFAKNLVLKKVKFKKGLSDDKCYKFAGFLHDIYTKCHKTKR